MIPEHAAFWFRDECVRHAGMIVTRETEVFSAMILI